MTAATTATSSRNQIDGGRGGGFLMAPDYARNGDSGKVSDMDELTTSIAGIDFPNPDKSKSNRRMECMLCAPGEPVELRPEPKNPFDENAIAIWSERGVQLGYVSAERAPFIGKRMKEDEITAVFQAMHGQGAYIRIRFGGGVPTLPDPVVEPARPAPPRPMRAASRPIVDPDAFYADPDAPEWGA